VKWSKNDVERFKRGYPDGVKIDSVEGNILVYSQGKWTFRARLLRGGVGMIYTVHFLEDNSDLFD
jgi:hypothetical protein